MKLEDLASLNLVDINNYNNESVSKVKIKLFSRVDNYVMNIKICLLFI